MRLEKEKPGRPGGRGRAESSEAGNLSAKYSTGMDLLRSARIEGDASVYTLEPEDVETLRACGFDPVSVGHGLYVCWEPSRGGESHA
jgi:hypothetical protein